MVTTVTAPGKIILFGEHAVVYGQPAIAIPLTQVEAKATVADNTREGVYIEAPDLGIEFWLNDAGKRQPLAVAVRLVQEALGLPALPDLKITVRSTIPIASGMGSGAAISAALIRALLKHLGRPDLAEDEYVSDLTYEVEKLYHGTPSGIDNTVVAFARPVYFVRRSPRNVVEPFSVAKPLHFLAGDTGLASTTGEVVGDVRRRWQAEPARFNALFAACGTIARAARRVIAAGDLEQLGQLMVENHRQLQEMTVSSPDLDRLVEAALEGGALGAKLSGAGRGGNMIALVTEAAEIAVRQTLLDHGARRVLATILRGQTSQPTLKKGPGGQSPGVKK